MSVTELALIVIAVAVAAQTLMMAAGFVAGARAWRRVETDLHEMQASFDQRLGEVSTRIDQAVVDARLAARAIENLATRADGLMQDASSTAESIRHAVTMPRALMATGAASAARWLLSKWRPRRLRTVGPVERLEGADIF